MKKNPARHNGSKPFTHDDLLDQADQNKHGLTRTKRDNSVVQASKRSRPYGHLLPRTEEILRFYGESFEEQAASGELNHQGQSFQDTESEVERTRRDRFTALKENFTRSQKSWQAKQEGKKSEMLSL